MGVRYVFSIVIGETVQSYRAVVTILSSLLFALLVGLPFETAGQAASSENPSITKMKICPVGDATVAGYIKSSDGQGMVFLADTRSQRCEVLWKAPDKDTEVQFVETCSSRFVCWHALDLGTCEMQDLIFDTHRQILLELTSILNAANPRSPRTVTTLAYTLMIDSSSRLLGSLVYVPAWRSGCNSDSGIGREFVYYDVPANNVLAKFKVGEDIDPRVACKVVIGKHDFVLVSEDMLSGECKRRLSLYSLTPFTFLASRPLDEFVWAIENTPGSSAVILVNTSLSEIRPGVSEIRFSEIEIEQSDDTYALSIAPGESITCKEELEPPFRAWQDYRLFLTREPDRLWILTKGHLTLDQEDAQFLPGVVGFSLDSRSGLLAVWHVDTFDICRLDATGVKKLSRNKLELDAGKIVVRTPKEGGNLGK